MNYSKYIVSLDVREPNSNVCLNAKKGDTSRTIFVNLTDGGFPYHITDDCYAAFTALKPDGNVLFNECSIENCVIRYDFTDQTVSAVGLMRCEVILYGGDGKQLTSAGFSIIVDDTVYDTETEVESTSEFNALAELIAKVNGLKFVKTVNGKGPDENGNVDVEVGGGVTSWNDLTDKPFGDEKVYYEWNRNTEYTEKEPLYDGTEVSGYMVKLSNDTPTSDFFIGKYGKAVFDGQEGDPTPITEEFLVIGSNFYLVAEFIAVALDTVTEFEINGTSATLTKGVWCMDLSDSPIESLKIIDPATPIPEKFIPDTIARVSQIPEIPESLVQSVNGIKPDENGNVNVDCSPVTADGTFLNLGYDDGNKINRTDDLNDYVTPGVYRYSSPNATVGTSNILNVPDTGINENTGGFRLIVSELSSSSSSTINSFMQTIIFDTPDYSTLQIWTRVHSKYGYGSGWSPWFKTATTSDVQAMIDASGGGGGLSRDEVQTMIDEALGVFGTISHVEEGLF